MGTFSYHWVGIEATKNQMLCKNVLFYGAMRNKEMIYHSLSIISSKQRHIYYGKESKGGNTMFP